jgi:hypothetical protein
MPQLKRLQPHHDFTIQHRPGAKIQHLDALSRHVRAVTIEPTILKDTVSNEQVTDAFCKSLNTESTNKRSEFFRDLDGFIYKRHKNGEPLMVVPKSHVSEVTLLCHNSIYAAHPGRKRTLDIVVTASGMADGIW